MTLTSLVFSFCPLKGVYELLPRVELGTSSLPRMRSTTELKQHESGKRDSNPRPPAWKASALSTELFPQIGGYQFAGVLASASYESKIFTRLAQIFRESWTSACDLCRSGCGWIRTTEAEKQQIYSLPHLATLEHTLV